MCLCLTLESIGGDGLFITGDIPLLSVGAVHINEDEAFHVLGVKLHVWSALTYQLFKPILGIHHPLLRTEHVVVLLVTELRISMAEIKDITNSLRYKIISIVNAYWQN